MKLAVISDIHGNMTAFDAVLADLAQVGDVDLIWHLGDYCAFGSQPAAVIQAIREQQATLGDDKVKVIGGNTDRYLVTGERFKLPPAKDEEAFNKLHKGRTIIDAVLNWNLAQLSWEDYEWLAKTLGRETGVSVDGYGHVIGFHAVPGDDEAMLRPDTPEEEATDYLLDREGRLAIGGHIHVNMDRTLGNWRMINVGSVGMSFDAPGQAQWGLFTFADGDVTIDLRAVDYNSQAAIDSIQQSDYPHPEWALKRLGINV